jgi:YD repeat-containing protein
MQKVKFSHRVISIFLIISFLQSILPVNYIYASNNGPNAPEASGFEPVDATDMVNLVSGDVSYVLPLLDMDGFPVTLGYHAGVPLDMESSWTGLGWNINTGAINRSVSGTPDDWKNGKSLDFIHFSETETFYNINVGIGISQAAEVGVGMAWGSNKSLSGSVYATVAFATASIDTDGNYSVGIGIGAGKGNYGGSIGISGSGNVNGGAFRVGVNVGVGTRNSAGNGASLGYSLTNGTISFSASANRTSYDKGQAGGGSISQSNYSSGDYDITSKGFYIPIQLGPFTLGFGKRKVTYSLDKGYPKFGYGALYANEANENINIGDFADQQNRYVYTDLYEEAIPSREEEFITDYQSEREKVNFSFASYDMYNVNATGITGTIQPKILENGTLFGIGYQGADTDNTNRKMEVYYHNGASTSKTFGANNSSDIKFYFNGQFTQNTTIQNSSISNVTANGFDDYLGGVSFENNRQQSANFVEVYTNQQLATGNTTTIIKPENADYQNWPADGIGAYKITAADGKTYHYSLPVYHYEQVERNLIKDNTENNVNEKRQYSPYATHWLLTAITGPDYLDVNSDGKPDEDDYGYWVRLDHGKWSDGYVWRSPYKGKKYNTNLAGEIEDKDFGNYQYGRKQLYYLDKIVTREHIAYFVKDIRYDSTGAVGENDFSVVVDPSVYKYSFNGTTNVENDSDYSSPVNIRVQENISYKREYQLLLDKIVVVENNGSTVGKNTNPSLSLADATCFPGYDDDVNSWNPFFNVDGGFRDVYGLGYTYALHQEQNVYDVTDFNNFDYTQAFKVIDLNYNYSLAQNSPSSISCGNEGSGRLTLEGVYFRGKNNFGYMPPYRFEYKNEMEYPAGMIFQKANEGDFLPGQAKDAWGFIDEKQVADQYSSTDFAKYGPDNWSLTEIQTPTGGKIKIEYEEDDYEQEAFSRKLWQDNLQFAVEKVQNQSCGVDGNGDNGPCMHKIFVKNLEGLLPQNQRNFADYFEVGEKVYLDLWIGTSFDQNSDFSNEDYKSYFSIPGQDILIQDLDNPNGFYPLFDPDDRLHTDVTVANITEDNVLILDFGYYNFEYDFWGQTDFRAKEIIFDFNDFEPSKYFGKKNGVGSNIYESKPRGQFPNDLNGGGFHHTMAYKLLANKVPTDLQGGGLRAKNITISDDNGREYETNYYYNQPGTARDKNDVNYVSSGITSFAPENGIKFIPYQTELPGAGVMYEYVTMVPVSTNGNELGNTRYRFHTLDPVFNLFDPNLEMKYESEVVNSSTGLVESQDVTVFKSMVTDHGNGDYFDANNKAYAKTIDLKINTSLAGQFRSMETFNVEGQLLSKSQKFYENSYLGPNVPAKNIPGRGTIKESFQSMKSVFTTDNNGNGRSLKDRYISISSKEDFSTVLNEVRTLGGGFTQTERYSNADLKTGAFQVTETTRADGTQIRTTQVPAYTEYGAMGSKVDNINNRHMLTQKAMTISDVYVGNQWLTNAVSVNTWRNQAVYDNNSLGNPTNDGIWRKYQNFIWKDDVDNNGTYGTTITSTDFNWGLGVSQSNAQWQKVSETTRYDHWSNPLEIVDINGNYIATKMGDDNKKILATSNAAYNEMFYSGAEDLNGSSFGGHVLKGTATLTSSDAHTGVYALEVSSGQTAFVVSATEGNTNKYKASVWARENTYQNVRLNVSGTNITYNQDEIVRAGEWVQLNFYFDVSGTQSINIAAISGTITVDDFRLHPITSSMTSYVYNEWDELTHIIGSNNMATRYEYDQAGRLISTYSEVADFNGAGSGGFKKVSENRYTYKMPTN